MYEDTGQYDDAYACYSEANAIKHSLLNYSVGKAFSRFESIKDFFSKQNLDELASKESSKPRPIFILGMPRSGTTLVEQVLSSHPKVYGAGELEDIRLISEKKLLPLIKKSFSSKQYKSKLIKNLQISAAECLKKLHNIAANCPVVTDKMPGNFEFIGFILAMFPDAKIIHCQRDAMDNCWSLFKNYFPHGQAFSYDQDDLGRYYQGYHDLMQFWQGQFNAQIYNVSYEEMVSDTETKIRNLLKFCDLEWNDSCLQFHENKRVVKTASVTQVRQPIYKASVNIAENYKKHLTVLSRYLVN